MKRSAWIAAITVGALLGLLPLTAAQSRKSAVLAPPKGAGVALVVFEDLQCPDCSRADPLVDEAARTYKIPLVRHDFPLPQHKWAFDAAVLARWFDTKSAKIGNEFRAYIFRNQPSITPDSLRGFAERFAAEHKLELPFMLDPNGQLAAKVKADRDLGIAIGIEHTPTIYVVSNKTAGQPFVEVVDRTQLFRLIEQMQPKAAVPSTAAARKK